MATAIQINGITGDSPFNIYICQSDGSGCFYISTISTFPYLFDVPPPYDTATSYIVKAIDNVGCSITGFTYIPPTMTPTMTPTKTPTQTKTPTPTKTPTQTKTPTPTKTPTQTKTPGLSPDNTPTPTKTPTQTKTPGLTPDNTPTKTPTQTPSPTKTPTQTPTATLPLGECVEIQNFNASPKDYSWIQRDGTSACITLDASGTLGDTTYICIKSGTLSSVVAHNSSDGTCSGGAIPGGKTLVGTDCTDDFVCLGITATPTQTPTQTPTPPSYYYSATQFTCPGCSHPTNGFVLYSNTPKIDTEYYNVGDGFVYFITGETSGPSYDVDISLAASNASCSIACII